jgi:hypothetical protein
VKDRLACHQRDAAMKNHHPLLLAVQCLLLLAGTFAGLTAGAQPTATNPNPSFEANTFTVWPGVLPPARRMIHPIPAYAPHLPLLRRRGS